MSLDEVARQEYLYLCGKIYHRDLFGTWQITWTATQLQRGALRYAVREETGMKRTDAVKIIHEIFETDTYGFRDSMTDEQTEAIQMALNALEFPER